MKEKLREFLIKLSSLWIFHRWHPEVALRYLPVVEEIKKMKGNPSILEVGSGGLGIAPYLKRQLTGVDVEFYPPFHPLLKRIKVSANRLSFKNNSFDVVVSVDTLEHLDNKRKAAAISEMLRVAKKKVLIAVPCGKAAYYQDVVLDKIYKEKFSKNFLFLDEQVKLGLPEKQEICDMILKAAKISNKIVEIEVKGNENLVLRKFLMRGWMSKNFLVDIFFRKILLLAIPILRHFNQEPCYRQLFFVDIKHEDSH